jgi:hypothetical protein
MTDATGDSGMHRLTRSRPLLSLVIVCLAITAGCEGGSSPPQASPPAVQARESDSAKTVWVDPNAVQQGPVQHVLLPPPLVERIKRVHQIFADVEGTPLEKWLDDFKRDLDPEENVRIWEDMAVAYEKYLAGREVPVEIRKEVFGVVLFRSMASEQDVLSRIKLRRLTPDDARKIMAGYPSAPAPITIIKTP